MPRHPSPGRIFHDPTFRAVTLKGAAGEQLPASGRHGFRGHAGLREAGGAKRRRRRTHHRRHAPRRCVERAMSPPPHRDRDDPPDAGMEFEQPDESAFRHPVDRELRPVRSNVGDDRQRVHDVAERRGADDENGVRRPIGRALRGGCVALAGPGGRGCAHAAIAMRRCRGEQTGETS